MAPLTLTQDRLARGQDPGPSSLPPTRSTSSPKAPRKSRTPRGLLSNDGMNEQRVAVEGIEKPTAGAVENEMWEEAQLRHKAAVILGSWEMVTWHSIAGHESNPQTILRLKRMMIGLKDEPGSDQWEDERNPGDDDHAHSSSKYPGNSPQTKGKKKH